MCPNLDLPVDKEQYESAGSKFITFPPGFKKGDLQYRKVECGVVGWDTPGKSIKVEIAVIEDGIDAGKEEKLSFGVDEKGIWKGKIVYKNITGSDMPMKKGVDGKMHPYVQTEAISGKPAVGQWQIVEGKKGGIGETIIYPKLVDLLPADFKVNAGKDIV